MIPNEEITPVTCPNCGSTNIETRIQTDTIEQAAYSNKPAATIHVDVPGRTCRDCAFSFLDEEAEALYHEAICRHLEVLSPREIKSVRERHGLSRDEFAQLTKIGRATLSRWERGCLVQNASNDQFLYLLSYQDNIERLRMRRSSSLPEPEQASTYRPGAFRAVQRSERMSMYAESFQLVVN